MKAYAVVLKGHHISELAFSKLLKSSERVKNDFTVENFNAVIPEEVPDILRKKSIRWNWPWTERSLDIQSGMVKSPYRTNEKKKRIACFLSHYSLWEKCVDLNEPIIILEHDAIFKKKVELSVLLESNKSIIALNDPIGATRKSREYHDAVVSKGKEGVVPVPYIDSREIPQGLPGNSAYLIKPGAAKKLIELTEEYGAWPNDALMCKQLMPEKLGIVYPYCTKVQGTQSTTSD